MRKIKTHGIWHRSLAAALSLSMMLSVCDWTGLLTTKTYADEPKVVTGGTQGVTRQADPSTMDTYKDMLDFSENTRYVGRLWSDKSVFALGYADTVGDRSAQKNGGTALWDKNGTLTLTPELDGVTGNKTVTLDEDFLHVYSALGSSLEVKETAPLDVMFVVDVSGSMGSTTAGAVADGDTFDQSAISKTVEAINSAITQLLGSSPESRFGIAVYGATAAVLVPLGHYKEGRLGVEYKDRYGGVANPQGVHYLLTATVTDREGDITNYYADNAGETSNDTHNMNGTGNRRYSGTGGQTTGTGTKDSDPYHVGHITNPQAGLSIAMDQFIENSERTWETHDGKICLRIPALIHLTDGQASDIAWIQPEAEEAPDEQKWKKQVSNWNNVNWNFDLAYNSMNQTTGDNKWNASQLTGEGDAAPVIFQTLMTAAYYKSAVDAFYNQDNVTDANGKPVSLACYSVYASDTDGYAQMTDPQKKATIDAILGPDEHFRSSEGEINHNTREGFINEAYKLYNKWAGSGIVNDKFDDRTTSYDEEDDYHTYDITIELNATQDQVSQGMYSGQDWNKNITVDKISENINYVPEKNFLQTGFSELGTVFSGIIQQLVDTMFTPVSGTNDLGVENAVTYMDPVGKYMDVKDVKNLLLFGTLYNITKTAVYDYQWNHQYMVNKEEHETTEALTEGWYKGEPTATGNKTGNAQVEGPCTDFPLPDGSPNAAAAWANGWVYRLNYSNASKFVPTLASINNNDGADETITKMRHTEYTFYRIADGVDRNQLHLNPAYLNEGEKMDTRQEEETILASRGVTDRDYDPDKGTHLETPGVYALSDLRIWVEDSGDFNDTDVETGGVQSDANFDEALWVNIPINMLPLRTVSIDVGETGETNYTTNLTDGSPAYKAGFPLRVFYTVGVSDEVLENNRINIAGAIDAEYILQSKITDAAGHEVRNIPDTEGNVVEFFSNWYNPLNRYDAYATTNTDYTFGDPVTTFSPAAGNRYYIFEKALPLYGSAYVWVESEKKWRRVSIEEDLQEGSADDRTFSATGFGGKLIAVDLDVAAEPTSAEEATTAINNALNDLPEDQKLTPDQLQDGDMVLLHPSRMTDVKRPTDEELEDEDTTDPFSSDGYYFLPIEYYELGKDGHATWTQYVITRKGSEFGSAYESSHITNGDMLCWHDMSGKDTQDYPYLSYTETGDYSRGKDFIGWPIDPDTGYYKGYGERDDHQTPDTSKYDEVSDGGGSWNDVHGEYLQDDRWVLCAKPGGLRVGNLAQSVQSKSGDPTKPEENEKIKEYYKTKYKDTEEKVANLTWTYYTNNVTRTANNYYVPTISNSSDIENDGVRVNVYLGNNGRLYVEDTTLLVTKDFEDPEGQRTDPDQQFNYQVYLKGITGTLSAIVVRWNERSKSWQRQFHYIDLELDSQRFLQTLDGNKAMVDSEGCRVFFGQVETSSNGEREQYYYVEDCTSSTGREHKAGDPYNAADDKKGDNAGGPYYVYINRNQSPNISAPENGFRVYHNEVVDGYESVDSADVITEGQTGERGTFYAASVYLVSAGKYTTDWAGNESVDITEHNDGTLQKFKLLEIDPNISETTEIRVDTPYRTASSYWTKQVTFGVNANDDGDGKHAHDNVEAQPLKSVDLYDGIVPSYDYPNLFNEDNENTEDYLNNIADNTAEFSLGAGEALLFSGLPSNTVYRVTEKLTDDQLAAGYALKELRHNQQVGSVSTYRPGIQQLPVYYRDDATYGMYYGDLYDSYGYPVNYKGSETEKGLIWSVDKNGAANAETPVHYEPFHHTNAVLWEYYATMDKEAAGDNHHQPTGLVKGTSPFYIWDGKTSNQYKLPDESTPRYTVADNPSCKPLADGGCDEDMGDGNVRHYMFKDGEMLDQHYQGEGSGYIRNIARYLVTPTVHFGVKGEEQADASEDMREYKSNADYSGVYSVFGNTGTYEESANFVNTISNDKTETQINGKGTEPVNETDSNAYPGVQTGDTITYRIKWANATANPARVVIVDQLDKGVDFVKPEQEEQFGPNYFEKQENANTFLAGIYGQAPNTPTVDSGHVVIWDLGEQPSGSRGEVTLTVRVNATATEWWDYDGDGVADKPVDGSSPDIPDYLVRDRATVRVADNAYFTNTVVNPVGGPHKTEVDPGDGVMVRPGEQITYKITWENDTGREADIRIIDLLDKDVEFVSASDKGKYYDFSVETACDALRKLGLPTGGETSSNAQRDPESEGTETSADAYKKVVDKEYANRGLVYWELKSQPAGSKGEVYLTVKVLESAMQANGEKFENEKDGIGRVFDRAAVSVGNRPFQMTEIVENPTRPEKSETDENGDPSPGDGEKVALGQEITYEIKWRNDMAAKGTVTILDPLDIGVDFVKAYAKGYYYPAESGSDAMRRNTEISPSAETGSDAVRRYEEFTPVLEGEYKQNARLSDFGISADKGETGEADGEPPYKYHGVVVWTLEDMPAGAYGSVFLTVRVNENAEVKIKDQAIVQMPDNRNYWTNIPENPTGPAKTEEDPGDGKMVKVGDIITYKIWWRNPKDVEADVEIVDRIDEGLTFVWASDGGHYHGSANDENGPEGTETDSNAARCGKNYEDLHSKYEIDYNDHGLAHWMLEKRPAGSSGEVTLKVRVNKKALTSNENGHVYDKAAVRVANDPFEETNKVENPTPVKSEITPGDGELLVKPGDDIEYKITWQNTKDSDAVITITDKLDSGLDFDSASAGITSAGADIGGPGEYDRETRTIKWEFTAHAGESGYVTFKATVNDSAFYKDSVTNKATVSVDNDSQDTNEVENPTKTGNLQIRKFVGGGDANDRARSFTFTVRFTSNKTGRELTGSFECTGSVNGTIKSGESLTLKDRQRVQINGIPAGTKYEVTESDNEGFTVSVTNGTGEIGKDATVVAAFTNSKGTPHDPHDPDEPGNPPGNPKKYPPDDEPGPGNPGNPDDSSDNPSDNPSDDTSGPDIPIDHVTPKTGDTSDPVLWLSLLGFSLLGIFAVIKLYRKRDEASKDRMQT